MEKSNYEKAMIEEVDYFIECFMDDPFELESQKKELGNLSKKDLELVVQQVVNDFTLNRKINDTIRYYIFHR